ncbi:MULTISPECIES: Rieske 2Fe-2S domain-containing protein [Streptomyces]|uniref:Rieske 2Fe-2S domain-containing protein n=1 Tax=Streptomyces scabiei TaxID=1930 RepID=UPI001B30A69F|nr:MULTISPECIES: Rieske 2Fe-2S domain-containing protein [Streptomyces]MBP5868624.1 Rieske 2Fe-2S domain-containing protein [Streptomyces sp. LBUM 1485]MBP5892270.1 Rieske 2Fe-2S domain-containing protein [Streptomyces sp. LBUM 1481]MBP5915452.1 Rieske 2Fe-2S domain-containing protein [Streptomyces sp. LBUM 1486]MBP5922506.1 Rieske 2Fe-2S domain-containing protein [Streptomyces sp. LBUM 1483]MDX2690453.1 Rieske 2Fe-2S domain-containing protein [Streptomyces scabiei]
MRLRRSHDKSILDPAALPRDPRADEYPMPSVPHGWYAVLRSGELRAGRVVSLHYFGRALIAFRGSDGRAAVRDAHCPHYGAHLGVGGKVVDGAVQCPFHGWRFGTDGRCVEAPFATRTPKVSIGGFPVREHSGLVFVYAGPGEPAWEVPEIEETGSRDFASPIDDVCRARIHIQEMRENIVDESHFHFIHGQSEPPVQRWREDGPFAEARGTISRRVLAWDINNTFDSYMYGPGVMVVRVHGPVLSVTAVALTTPVDDRTSELRMLYYLRKPAWLPFLTPLFKLVFRAEALGEVREEVQIWDHKIHQPRPVLLPHEKGIRALRRWYAQFYPGQGEAAVTGSGEGATAGSGQGSAEHGTGGTDSDTPAGSPRATTGGPADGTGGGPVGHPAGGGTEGPAEGASREAA